MVWYVNSVVLGVPRSNWSTKREVSRELVMPSTVARTTAIASSEAPMMVANDAA